MPKSTRYIECCFFIPVYYTAVSTTAKALHCTCCTVITEMSNNRSKVQGKLRAHIGRLDATIAEQSREMASMQASNEKVSRQLQAACKDLRAVSMRLERIENGKDQEFNDDYGSRYAVYALLHIHICTVALLHTSKVYMYTQPHCYCMRNTTYFIVYAHYYIYIQTQ
jgi:hypothetical protein